MKQEIKKLWTYALRSNDTFIVLLLCVLWVIPFVCLYAQTQIDGHSQVKNISPIVSAQRWQCTGTNTIGGVSYDCSGLQMFKFTLSDGTILGPFIAIPATPAEAASASWQNIPLGNSQ